MPYHTRLYPIRNREMSFIIWINDKQRNKTGIIGSGTFELRRQEMINRYSWDL